MRRLKIIVNKRKAQKTGKEYFAYKTIKSDGSYIDCKFNSQNIDPKSLPEKTFIIYVKPEAMNEKTKMRDNQPIVSEKTGNVIKELWVSEIDHYASQEELDKDNAEYRKAHSEKIAEEYPEA